MQKEPVDDDDEEDDDDGNGDDKEDNDENNKMMIITIMMMKHLRVDFQMEVMTIGSLMLKTMTKMKTSIQLC